MAWLRDSFRKFARGLRASSLTVWLAIVVFLAGMAVLFWLLASGRIPGVPDASVKPVTLYASPQSDATPVTLYVQPPASTLQAGETGQVLALQFFNHAPNAMALGPTTAEPRNCFELQPLQSSPGELAAGQTVVALYRLTAKSGSGGADAPSPCDSQVALTLRYSYATSAAIPTTKGTMPMRGEGFVSTSPILLTTNRKVQYERFFRVASALAIPLLLAVATFLIQQFQTQKGDQQKSQELKLEVWKILFPIVNGHMDKHYIKLVQTMKTAQGEIRNVGVTNNGENLTAISVVLQKAYDELYEQVGGFNFRTMPAEFVCGGLSDQLWADCTALAGNDAWRWTSYKAAISRDDEPEDAARKLKSVASHDPDMAAALTALQNAYIEPGHMDRLNTLLIGLMLLLSFEENRLWYPEWYDTPPKLNFDAIYPAVLQMPDDTRKDMKSALTEYWKTIPPECRGPYSYVGLLHDVRRLLARTQKKSVLPPNPPAPMQNPPSQTVPAQGAAPPSGPAPPAGGASQ